MMRENPILVSGTLLSTDKKDESVWSVHLFVQVIITNGIHIA